MRYQVGDDLVTDCVWLARCTDDGDGGWLEQRVEGAPAFSHPVPCKAIPAGWRIAMFMCVAASMVLCTGQLRTTRSSIST